MGSGSSSFDTADSAIHWYIQQMKANSANSKAVDALQWMRTEICSLLREDVDNCSLNICVNNQADVLDCIIGRGETSVMIVIIGDHIQWFISGKQVEHGYKNYARFIADCIGNRGLTGPRTRLPLPDKR